MLAPTPLTTITAPQDAASTRALVCHQLSNDLSGVALARWPLGAPGPGQARVRMQAVALNFPDLLMTRGLYQFKPPVPFVPGMEGSGTVVAAGPGSRWREGDAVLLSGKTGLLADEVVLDDARLQAVPPGVDLQAAAALQVTALTAWVALARIGRLQRGETLLVHGARGGVGQACVQLGLHLGAKVIATATRPEVLAAALPGWAAEGVTLLPSTGFREPVLAATGGRGADVVADPVGGDVFDESARCTAFGGRLLVLGFASGRIATVPTNRPLIKGFSVVGVRAGEYGRHFPAHHAEHLAAVRRLAQAGVFRPHIGARWPLAEAKAALAAMEHRDVVGKIVVTFGG